jgi:hypothetical protein
MRVAPLTGGERRYIETLIGQIGGRRTIRAKSCWKNSQRLILNDHEKRLRYCEGGFPMPHAWVTINGKIVDVTAEAIVRCLKRRGRRPDREYEYLGVVINRRTMLRHLLRTNVWGPVIPTDNWPW